MYILCYATSSKIVTLEIIFYDLNLVFVPHNRYKLRQLFSEQLFYRTM